MELRSIRGMLLWSSGVCNPAMAARTSSTSLRRLRKLGAVRFSKCVYNPVRAGLAGNATVQLYLDCDGVLADFQQGADKLLGMDRFTYQKRFGRKKYLQALKSAPDFYGTLSLKPDARKLFSAIEHLDPVILTAVPERGWAESQKQAWCARYFPRTRLIITTVRGKSRYCSPGDVLVDDNRRHELSWSKAGGVFVHHVDARSTLENLRRIRPMWFRADVSEGS
jgi:hypothetical protein